ncbi:GGDEF domain-containing protein [Litchfieldella xinjiangensis]|uniref:GGDEF domain-containing protein n=1 Tax=Litchfieldella xinjiangensis TaxID=1166948 RepID=UPI000A6A02E2|nr:hypothetical protein [Halomonas xinjiangensis]
MALSSIWQSITAVRDVDGEVRNFVAVFHDIAERKRIEQELERKATRDHLTGLHNRRAFDEAMCLVISPAIPRTRSCCEPTPRSTGPNALGATAPKPTSMCVHPATHPTIARKPLTSHN